MKEKKFESKKNEEKGNLLMYCSAIVIPLSLSAIGTTVLLVGNLSLETSIVLGGGVIITGIQAVTACGQFCKDILKTMEELKDINEKENIDSIKEESDDKVLTKEKIRDFTVNKNVSKNNFNSINHPKITEKNKVLIKTKY